MQSLQGTNPLQTVQEERAAPESPVPVSYSFDDSKNLDQSPSSRPLGRRAHDHISRYARNSEAAKRSVYAQEGDVQPNEFKQSVAELLKEEEYGIFRLVVPLVGVGRAEFDSYVRWLNGQPLDQDGMPTKESRSVYGLRLLDPFSRFSLCWMTVMATVDLVWTAFGVPINVAFCSIDYGRWGTNCTSTDLVFGIIYTLNLLLSFNMGMIVVNGHRKKKVLDGRRAAWYYVRYGRFVLDLVATIPLVYLIVVLGASGGRGSRAKWVNAVSLVRLLRLLRLVSMSKVIYIDSALGGDSWLAPYLNVTTLYIFMVGFQIAVLINLFASILVLLAYLHGLDQSWMTAVSWTDLPEQPPAYQWYCAVYWVTTTTTTTGFGDFSPRWWGEQVVIGLAMICGMIVFGILVGWITNALARASSTADRLQDHIKKISQVNDWLSNCKDKLSDAVRLDIQEYFAQLYVAKQTTVYGEAELFDDLPPYLRFKVAGEMALPLIQRVHALRDLNADAQQFLAAHLRPVRAIVGQELCRQGDEADRLWLLESGRLVALRHKEHVEEVLAPALVGESLILAIDIPQCRHRPWTLRAAAPCELWELQLADLSRVVQIYPALRLALLEKLRMDLVKVLFLLGAHPDEDLEAQLFPQREKDWCELLALLRRMLRPLQNEDLAALDEMCIDLERANIEDGSLQARMAELIEGAMIRDGLEPSATLGLPLALQQQVQEVQQAEQQARSEGKGPALHNGVHKYPFNRLPSGAKRTDSGMPGGVHDTHHGPAPWGVTTEDVLAALHRRRASYSVPEDAAAQMPYTTAAAGGGSWHGSGKAASPVRQAAAVPAQGMPALPEGRLMGRLDVLKHTHTAASDTGNAQSDQPMRPLLRQAMTAAVTGPLDLPSVDGEEGDRSGLGGGGTDSDLAAEPGAPMPPRPLPSPPPELEEEEDDPIAAETGWVSPKVLQQQQKQDPELPALGTGGGGDASGSPSLAATSNGPWQGPAGAGLHATSRLGSGGGGRSLRSQLSRFSSPFAGMNAPGLMHAAGSTAAAAGGPAPRPAGPPRAGHPVAAAAPPSAAGAAAGSAAASCVACGTVACPLCGAWAATPPSHPFGQRYSAVGLGVGSSGSSDPIPGATIAPASSGQLVRPSVAVSLTEAVRGVGGGRVGSINIRQRSVVSPPQYQQPWQRPALLQIPPLPAAWASGGSEPPATITSPSGALGRQSRMFGRSFAASRQIGSLVRHTLMRETYGPTYTATQPEEEEELAAESAPQPARDDPPVE